MLGLFGLLLLRRGQLVDGGGRLLVPRLLRLPPRLLLLVVVAHRVPVPVNKVQSIVVNIP